MAQTSPHPPGPLTIAEYEALGGRTPAQVWEMGEGAAVQDLLERAYLATMKGIDHLRADTQELVAMEAKIAELKGRYGS